MVLKELISNSFLWFGPENSFLTVSKVSLERTDF